MLDVTCAAPQRHGPLTVFPLIAATAPELPLTLLADALRDGSLTVTEIGEGMVPALLARNGGKAGVLVLDGEQLVGAKQNRTTNRSLILPAGSETRIPVSCMEQGRWRHGGEDFRPTKQSSPSTVRRKAREVEEVRARGAGVVPVSALAEVQGAVWSTIADYSASLGAHSPTGALDEIYQTREADIDRWAAGFPAERRQIGMLAFLGDRPLGLDAIGSVTLYGALHERLVRGYVLDALGHRGEARPPTEEAAQRYLRRIGAARRVPAPTVGSGEYAILSGGVVGGELTLDGALVHLSAFPVVEHPPRADVEEFRYGPIAPPSRRWRTG
jgi:hypothetical protein